MAALTHTNRWREDKKHNSSPREAGGINLMVEGGVEAVIEGEGASEGGGTDMCTTGIA